MIRVGVAAVLLLVLATTPAVSSAAPPPQIVPTPQASPIVVRTVEPADGPWAAPTPDSEPEPAVLESVALCAAPVLGAALIVAGLALSARSARAGSRRGS